MLITIYTNLIIQDIKEPLLYLSRGLIYGIILTIILLLLEVLWNIKKEKLLFNPSKILCYALFATYIYALLMESYFSRSPGSRHSIDLIFLQTWTGSPQSKAYVIENILMMLPFGYLLPTILKPARNILCCVPLGFMFSTCLEYAQFLSQRGYMQVDDIVMNTIGTLIGFISYTICRLLILEIKKYRLSKRKKFYSY